MIDWHLACCHETCIITFLDIRFCLPSWNNVFFDYKPTEVRFVQYFILLSERVKKLFKSYLTRDRPESPKRSMIFFEEFFGEAGFSPRGSELRKILLSFFCSLVWRCIYFWSASSKITAHSAAVKFSFRFVLFWAIVFILAREARMLAHADNHYRNSTTSSLSTG